MHAVEFTTELGPNPILSIPQDAAAQLPKAGKARVIVLTSDAGEDGEWQQAGYEQFLREDWSKAAAQSLARAYGDEEPDYSQVDVKP